MNTNKTFAFLHSQAVIMQENFDTTPKKNRKAFDLPVLKKLIQRLVALFPAATESATTASAAIAATESTATACAAAESTATVTVTLGLGACFVNSDGSSANLTAVKRLDCFLNLSENVVFPPLLAVVISKFMHE